jgi:very-short-patch-repair endonuclease
LRLIASAAAERFEVRCCQLTRLTDVVRPDADVPIERLPADLASIAKMREALGRRERADESLRTNGADLPADLPNGGHDAAIWILELAAHDADVPLMRAVASDSEQRLRVRQIADGLKRTATAEFLEAWTFLKSIFDIKANVSAGITILETPCAALAKHLAGLRDETASLDGWLKFSRWQRDMDEVGFGPVIEELFAGRYVPQEAADAVAVQFYRKLFDHLTKQDEALGDFDLEEHERVRERFRQLDEWEIKAAATRIRQYQLGRDDRPRPGWSAPGTSELGILQRETQKKRRHMPLRRLFAEIPSVLQRLKPCIMMSPLSVSTFLQSDEIRFDLVIFDEASQVFPWDAIGAIYRGTQLIVAGDEKQLPPTNFFNRGDVESEEDEDDDIGDFESILKLCKSMNMPSKGLRWHYRSRREPLIAFSNRHFYDGDLVTFPSIRDGSNDSVRLELVQGGRWVNRKNMAEAERVADLIIAHHRTRPEVSLGVIAFNSTQQQAIEDVLHERRRQDAELDALFNVGATEPMFIKNLESVQGDERDVIVLSMGYAYNDAGKFLKNFGPLTKAGGERRLNVAVTRAREEIVLVASVRAADMDLTESHSEGSQLLKAYLEYAERGVESLAKSINAIAGDCESPFEEEVAAALVRQGLRPVPQVGCGGFRIDLALTHPLRPGEFCLGIECDGATYHSSKTARDRDRIRQSVLEDLGWRIVRVWSTDWVRNPQRQLDRILAAYEVAVPSAGGVDSLLPGKSEEGDKHDDDLQPRFVDYSEPAGRTFTNIDDVPDGRIRESAKAVIVRAGATDLDDLLKLVARDLGFTRTGTRIRKRLKVVLNRELSAGSFRRVGDRIAMR